MVSANLIIAALVPLMNSDVAGEQTMYVISETAGESSGDFQYTYNNENRMEMSRENIAGSYRVGGE